MHPQFRTKIGMGMGSTRNTPAETLKDLRIDHHIVTIHSDSMNWGTVTTEELVDWVMKQVRIIAKAKRFKLV